MTQEDLPYIISDVLKHDLPQNRVRLISYWVSTAYGLKPCASFRIDINGVEYETNATGDGQYDAFMQGLRQIYVDQLKRPFPLLTNYSVTIPPADAPTPSCRPSSPGVWRGTPSAPAGLTPTRPTPPFRPHSKCSTCLKTTIRHKYIITFIHYNLYPINTYYP